MAKLVTIEGNIGSGKTTIARMVADYMPDSRFFPAPEHHANPHWQLFLTSPMEHASAMQRWFLLERLRVYAAALRHMEHKRESAVLDFSIWSDIIFAKAHLDAGSMTSAEFDEYAALAKQVFALQLPPPHLSILLEASPEVCMQRCEASATRSSQPDLSAAHLQRVDLLYKQRWMQDLESVFTPRRLQGQRVDPAAASLPAAPSMLTLVRDWSDVTNIKASAIADAVLCTEPTDFELWMQPFRSCDGAARANALIETNK